VIRSEGESERKSFVRKYVTGCWRVSCLRLRIIALLEMSFLLEQSLVFPVWLGAHRVRRYFVLCCREVLLFYGVFQWVFFPVPFVRGFCLVLRQLSVEDEKLCARCETWGFSRRWRFKSCCSFGLSHPLVMWQDTIVSEDLAPYSSWRWRQHDRPKRCHKPKDRDLNVLRLWAYTDLKHSSFWRNLIHLWRGGEEPSAHSLDYSEFNS